MDAQINLSATVVMRALFHPESGRRADDLRAVAREFEARGYRLGAGYMAAQAAATPMDPREAEVLLGTAWEHYRHVIDSAETFSLERILALQLASELVHQQRERRGPLPSWEHLSQELAQSLMALPLSVHLEEFLVRGFELETDLQASFTANPAAREARLGVTTWMDERWTFNVPSAFTLARNLGDHQLACSIADRCPDAFTTPGLRGWRSAMRAMAEPNLAAEHFETAAIEFGSDVLVEDSEGRPVGGAWDNMNSGTWAPYFHVRSLLAQATRAPDQARELIARAAGIADPEAGHRAAPRVRQLAILVRALHVLFSASEQLDLNKVREEFRLTTLLSGSDDGARASNEALTLVDEAFEGFRKDPARELVQGRLGRAQSALDRLPFVDAGVPEAISRAAADHALTLINGDMVTWVHRVLEGIEDERMLHKILLRLSQASLPVHAQVLHGPVEYGKDVIVHVDTDEGPVLRSYQVKAGDITKGDWHKITPQLEEIFTVPLPEFIVPAGADVRRQGILFFNGHIGSHAQPSVDGWLKEQRRAYGREYRLMDLDKIVRWIFDDRLVNEFRAALADLGIPVTPAPKTPISP